MKKSVICHFFYPDISRKLLQDLQRIDDKETIFLINILGNLPEHKSLLFDVKRNLNNVKILKIPDQGRDIGAKLFLADLLIELKTESLYTLIIHDKKSPHLDNGDKWRNELYKIIEPKYLSKVFRIFEENRSVGIVASARFIDNEYNEIDDSFRSNSNCQIKELIKRYSIKTNDYDFVAGNIFWMRTELLKTFFSTRSILEIRSELETGNVLDFNKGTFVHAWERIMSWIATCQGYKIYGI